MMRYIKKCKTWFIDYSRDIGFFMLVVGILLLSLWIFKDNMKAEWNWCDAVSALASFVAVIGGWFTLKTWRRDKSRSQCEFVTSLMDEMSKDGVQRILDLTATTGGTEIFNSSKVSDNDEADLLSTIKFFSRICYMQDEKLISSREAKMFDGMMRSVAGDKNIQSFLGSFMYRNGWSMDNNPYSLFLQYVKECDDTFSINYEDEIEESDNGDNEMLKESDFDQPTIIIKINRLWREGMTPDEIYEVTRGWWRVRLEKAEKAKLALSVGACISSKVVRISMDCKNFLNSAACSISPSIANCTKIP